MPEIKDLEQDATPEQVLDALNQPNNTDLPDPTAADIEAQLAAQHAQSPTFLNMDQSAMENSAENVLEELANADNNAPDNPAEAMQNMMKEMLDGAKTQEEKGALQGMFSDSGLQDAFKDSYIKIKEAIKGSRMTRIESNEKHQSLYLTMRNTNTHAIADEKNYHMIELFKHIPIKAVAQTAVYLMSGRKEGSLLGFGDKKGKDVENDSAKKESEEMQDVVKISSAKRIIYGLALGAILGGGGVLVPSLILPAVLPMYLIYHGYNALPLVPGSSHKDYQKAQQVHNDPLKVENIIVSGTKIVYDSRTVDHSTIHVSESRESSAARDIDKRLSDFSLEKTERLAKHKAFSESISELRDTIHSDTEAKTTGNDKSQCPLKSVDLDSDANETPGKLKPPGRHEASGNPNGKPRTR